LAALPQGRTLRVHPNFAKIPGRDRQLAEALRMIINTAKLFLFLRDVRHELFNEEFQT
jgi:hypothetical protein